MTTSSPAPLHRGSEDTPDGGDEWPRWIGPLLLLTGMTLATTAVAISIWVGGRLMMQPQLPNWLSRWVSTDSTAEPEAPQPWTTIQARVTAVGQRLGTPVPLTSTASEPEGAYVLWPILTREPACGQDCWAISELRVYRRQPDTTPPLWQLITRQSVPGVTDAAIVAPLLGTPLETTAAPHRRPLTSITALPSTPGAPGDWLLLYSDWQQGLRYGQLVHFDPQHQHLNQLLPWSSPSGKLPRWQDLDGSPPPELVVDATVGLEPSFTAYQIRLAPGSRYLQLQTISLLPAALEVVSLQSAYQQALQLARAGVWSEAHDRLQALKQRAGSDWTIAAAGQLSLIALHADYSQVQADRTWATPSQQVLAALLDGRWQAALSHLEQAPEASDALWQLLADDRGRLWNRVIATLRITPDHESVQIWGGLILAAQESPAAAHQWLAQQAQSLARQRFSATLATLEAARRPTTSPSPSEAAAAATPRRNHSTPAPAIVHLLGQATPLSLTPADWQLVQSPPALSSDRRWYAVHISHWQTQQGWQQAQPAADWSTLASRQGWIGARPLTMVLWQQQGPQATPVQVYGWRLRQHTLSLLVPGPVPTDPDAPFPPLVTSLADLTWPSQEMATPLPQFLSLYPHWRDRIASLFHLQSLASLPPSLATASLYQLPLGQDSRPATLLRLAPSPQTPASHPPTLIVAADGTVLYDDRQQAQAFVALARSGETPSVLALVHRQGKYVVVPVP
ncbi:atrophin-1 family protein [Halomicronema hongdechloris]|uniref:hypothetical protein n=1 Tax=Halomicronema hongdechloris TaxID=1209493 RepID=UPI0010CBC574|nr:hypothetical protein [Halomicronema hongdechloris]